jgi:2-octaprenylphenol hydroxylase
MGELRHDLIIVGGGMVGATLACALGDSPLRVALVESGEPDLHWDPEQFDLRVSAITRATQRVFEAVGAWPQMLSRRAVPYTAMHVWDATGRGAIDFRATEVDEPDLGHIVENRIILAALHERLAAFANVELLCPAGPAALAPQADHIELRLEDGQTLRGRLIAGADGAGSWVRREAGITTTGWPYRQSAVVATVRTSRHHEHAAWQRFTPDGPLALLPLTDNHLSVVWSTTPEHAEQLLTLDDSAFLDALQAAFGQRLGRMEWCGPRAAFSLALQHADDYVRPRIALLGNAAHSIHPLAGQGLNLGVADAAALAEVLLAAHARGRDIGALPVLRRYERWRKGENVAVMAAMDGFKRLFGARAAPLRWARNLGLNVVNSTPAAKDMLIRRAMGLRGDLPRMAKGR